MVSKELFLNRRSFSKDSRKLLEGHSDVFDNYPNILEPSTVNFVHKKYVERIKSNTYKRFIVVVAETASPFSAMTDRCEVPC